MLPLAQMIQKRDGDAAQAYVDRQNIGIIPEIRAIVNDPKMDDTTVFIAYGYLRRMRTLESALLLADGFNKGGGRESVLGLMENPRPEVYPILKGKLRPPAKEKDKNLLLVMAQIPVPEAQRATDIRPYIDAKYFETRIAAVLSLALLDALDSQERMAHILGSTYGDDKQAFLDTFYEYRAWRIPKFVPVLIPVLNDPTPLKDIGVRRRNEDGSESYMTPEELRYVRAWDYALNIIVKTLNLDVPFKIADNVTYSKAQRDLVKQKLRDLGYTVTDEPYPVTDAQ